MGQKQGKNGAVWGDGCSAAVSDGSEFYPPEKKEAAEQTAEEEAAAERAVEICEKRV